jgi:adenylate cyclase
VRVVGVKTPIRLYELLDLREGAAPAVMGRVNGWERAMAFLEAGDFEAAKNIFSNIAKNDGDDGVAKLYAERCGKYIDTPPAAGWDGVYNLTEK